jgi:tetratricopeptide (TPR) repeat protein
VPLDWAQTQMNLGDTLSTLGEREGGTARLEEAVAAYRSALKEWTRDRASLHWAYLQQGLAKALAVSGLRLKDPLRLKEALVCVHGAVEVYQQAGEGYWRSVAERRVIELKARLAEMAGVVR